MLYSNFPNRETCKRRILISLKIPEPVTAGRFSRAGKIFRFFYGGVEMSKSKKEMYYRNLPIVEITSDRIRKWHYQQLIAEEEEKAALYERAAKSFRESAARSREQMKRPWQEWKADSDQFGRMWA